MDAARWQRVRAMFDSVVDCPSEQWDALLEAACADAPDLRADVRCLLDADLSARNAPSALAQRAPALLSDAAECDDRRQSDAWIGRQLGAWRVMRSLGRGGMGLVYLAEREDGGFRQQAALKLLRIDLADDVARERFLSERQILAELEHPHIARLLDGGSTPDSGPWFTLEYVDGVPITAWCDSHRLGIRARLRLFLDVCAAVSYAHERLVIHRDLKPANILVDGRGQVKLLDFGIAKLLDATTDQTGTAVRVFTPDYAAPEQVRGERSTTATDVYALGVVLYELLTGCRPYRLAEHTPRAVEHAVLATEPQRPSAAVTQRNGSPTPGRKADEDARGLTRSQWRAALHGDLDAIVLKALRKEQTARYASVKEFADDLRNALALRPVQARRGGFRYSADRFLRRNALPVALGCATFFTLGAGLAVAIGQAHEAQKQRDVARREATTSQQALKFMEDLFALADPARTDGATVTAVDVLEQGRERIDSELLDQPAIRLSLLRSIGNAYLALGIYDSAMPLLEESSETALAEGDLSAYVRSEIGAIEVLQRRDLHDECLQRLARIEALANTAGDRSALADIDYLAAVSLHAKGRFDAASTRIREAIALRDAVPSERDDALDAQLLHALILKDSGQANEAASLVKDALTTAGPGSSYARSTALGMLGAIESSLGEHAEAERHFLQALDVATDVFGPQHPETLNATGNVAYSLYLQERYDEAATRYRELIDLRRRHQPDDLLALARAKQALCSTMRRLADLESAYAACRDSDRAQQQAPDATSRSLLNAKIAHGASAAATGRFDEAFDMLDSAVVALDALPGETAALQSALEWRAVAVLQSGRRARGCVDGKRLTESGTFGGASEFDAAYHRALLQACLWMPEGRTHDDAWRAMLASLGSMPRPDRFRLQTLQRIGFASATVASASESTSGGP